MSTWIKLDRDVVKHWIFRDEWKFKCWVDLLILANYSDNKVEIKGSLLTCKRGDLLYSLDSLSIRWNANKSKVRRFLKLLESDSMIVLKSEQVTTRITICKYDSYQSERNADETQMNRKRNADETQTTPIKERKEKKEIKECIVSSETSNKDLESKSKKIIDEEITEKFILWFNKRIFIHKNKLGKFKKLDKTDLNNYKELLKLYPEPTDWNHAFDMMMESEWIKTNDTATPKHFLVNGNFQNYVNKTSSKQKSVYIPQNDLN